ncbi:serine hydrolase [Ramlibacter sp. G-1-2-2]|uniref:Serine hydrolase n=1 Tax=Ramlibacter agri TaxID=2728837 RepID=A0A848GZ48_9BURK|nr:serine hydrolase [Ramlibacter agri]NML43976.1 serine hydrolase [Ramlibacter agri]
MRNFWGTLAGFVFVAAAQADTAWPTQGWSTATPESQGMSSPALQSLLDFGQANQADSVLVTRHGRIVLEAYYGPYEAGQLHAINSATKTVTSALVGLAVAQGLLPPAETPVVELMRGRTPANLDARKQAMQLQHLLDMDSGIAWIEPLADAVPETALKMYASRDWVQFVLDQPMAQAPGAGFNYNSGNSQLASAILAQAAGMTTEDYAAKQLFAPLGITQWRWRKDPGGTSTGGFGLYLHPRDMARLGLLQLRHGEWEGRQLLPRAWVDRAFAASLPMTPGPGADFRYANGWWTLPARGAFMAVGFNRQLIVVLPREDVVAVLTGRRHYDLGAMLDVLQRAVRSEQALAEDPAAAQALATKVRALATEPEPVALPPPALAQRVSGRTWKADPNRMGIAQFTLRLGERNECEIVTASGGTEVLPLGQPGQPARTQGARGLTVTRAFWTGESTLAVQVRYVNEGGVASWVLRFDGDRVEVAFSSTVNGFAAKFAAQAVD